MRLNLSLCGLFVSWRDFGNSQTVCCARDKETVCPFPNCLKAETKWDKSPEKSDNAHKKKVLRKERMRERGDEKIKE